MQARRQGGAMDASNLLKPALAPSGTIRCMGSTTYKREYRQHFEKDRALVRRFQKIDVATSRPSRTLSRSSRASSLYFEDYHRS
ncbi:hypothetical protein ACRAWF_06525 [Streptomyces sp. L7]